MLERTIEASEAPHIIIRECRGNLTVTGGNEQEITILVLDGEDELHLEEEDETISFSVSADCRLGCPSGTTLTLERPLGNVRVRRVDGPIDTGVIHGNATLQEVGHVSLHEALGNLSARGVAGNLDVGDVKGNVRVRGVSERLKLAEVGGNLVAEGLKGGVEAKTVRGNVQLGPPFSPDVAYRVSAGGNMTVRLPSDASLQLAVRARGNVHSGLPALDLEKEAGEIKGRLGDGRATLEADVRGNFSLQPQRTTETFEASVDFEDIGVHIERQVKEALAGVTSRLEASLGRVDTGAVERRAEQAAERARRQADRATEQARLRAERAERRWQRASGRKPRPKQAATDEEVLRVLRMVEEGKITPDQASELLAALE